MLHFIYNKKHSAWIEGTVEAAECRRLEGVTPQQMQPV